MTCVDRDHISFLDAPFQAIVSTACPHLRTAIIISQHRDYGLNKQDGVPHGQEQLLQSRGGARIR